VHVTFRESGRRRFNHDLIKFPAPKNVLRGFAATFDLINEARGIERAKDSSLLLFSFYTPESKRFQQTRITTDTFEHAKIMIGVWNYYRISLLQHVPL